LKVTGVVIDDQGRARWRGAEGDDVALAGEGWSAVRRCERMHRGGYTIGFTSNPWMIGNERVGRGAARAEVVAEGYDWYWRTCPRDDSHRSSRTFVLHRIQRVTARRLDRTVCHTRQRGVYRLAGRGPCGRLGVTGP